MAPQRPRGPWPLIEQVIEALGAVVRSRGPTLRAHLKIHAGVAVAVTFSILLWIEIVLLVRQIL